MKKDKLNVSWDLSPQKSSVSVCTLAVLMDIRNELQILNRVLACPRFQNIPQKLEAIRKNTASRKKDVKRRP